jgi:hypothetical protein
LGDRQQAGRRRAEEEVGGADDQAFVLDDPLFDAQRIGDTPVQGGLEERNRPRLAHDGEHAIGWRFEQPFAFADELEPRDRRQILDEDALVRPSHAQ